MKKETRNLILWILIGFFVVILFYFGIRLYSTSYFVTNQEMICNNPYIKVGESCCLDQNGNNICDNDEQQPVQLQEYCGDNMCQLNEKSPDCEDCKTNIRIENLRYEILKPEGQYKEFYISNYDVVQLGDKSVVYPGYDLYAGYSEQQCANKNVMSKIKDDFDCPGGCYFVVDSDKRGLSHYYLGEYGNGFQIETPEYENPLCIYFVFHLKPYPEEGIGYGDNPEPVAIWESPIISV